MIDNFTQWLKELWESFSTFIIDILIALIDFARDFVLSIFELFMDGFVYIFTLMQPPEFMANGLSEMTQFIHPDIAYFLGETGVAQGFAIYGVGVTFRLTRKLFTLGQW